ncbi:protealysin inhibitor emfourin [Demequina maris]|uniref:protealysin inhibitor emfourin n=1 Tax=Demequina maris TaxID=1638982 RepID=UPI0007811C3A|nr:protealysin inhibitor emfourin [Demequina maris]
MIIALEVSGGFVAAPGLAESHRLDTDAIAPTLAREVEAIVRSVNAFELPRRVGDRGRPGADRFTYALTFRQGERSHSVELVDPIADPDLARLVDIVRTGA